MALINHLGEELPDRWLYPQPETDAIPAPYTVVLAEALQGLERLPPDARPAGVLLRPEQSADLIAPLLDELDVVVVLFEKLRDGRGFTIAHALRNKHRFMGDVRAIGHLLPDQLPLLRQCEFTSIVTPAEHPPARWRNGNAAQDQRVQAKPLLQRLMNNRSSDHGA